MPRLVGLRADLEEFCDGGVWFDGLEISNGLSKTFSVFSRRFLMHS
jgi:hypothetical protein